MKFFRERQLTVQVAILFSFFAILLVVEFFIIRWKIASLEEVHHQRDFARKAQLTAQQVMINSNLLLQGQDNLAAEILAGVEQHDHMLKVLSEGGRVDGTSVFIDGLDHLPAISLRETSDHWGVFKNNVSAVALQAAKTEKTKRTLDASWISMASWYDKLISDMDVVVHEARSSLVAWSIFAILADLSLLTYYYFFFRRAIIVPLKLIENNTAANAPTLNLPSSEISDVAGKVNEIILQLKDASLFIQEIAKGNLKIDYKDLDQTYETGKNKLADSLIEMQNKLQQMAAEEQQRQWANEGLTKFVDIVRTGGENISILGDKIVAALVSYTRSNQGGLYLLNDDDSNNKYLELVSLFAFDTKKFETQKIKLGEGILGQTFLEKETTYLAEMPQEYIRITSGLGEANPKSLLVVPLKIDQTVYGVVELASFNSYEDHEIKFVERLSETIASSFASVKSAQRNRSLLEESHTVTEMMRAQEEEMRQNMEELQATQEEMSRKERDYIAKIHQLEQAKQGGSVKELAEANAELSKVKAEFDRCKKELAEAKAAPVVKGDDWAAAEEVERALRINLEALKITREELGGSHKG